MNLGIPPVDWRVVLIRDDKRQRAVAKTVIAIRKWATVGDVIDAQVLAQQELDRLRAECLRAWSEVQT